MKTSGIGGQAVIEGVMMKNKKNYAVAVRLPDGSISVEQFETKGLFKSEKIKKIPILRGMINFVESMGLGIKALTFSASFYDEEEEQDKPQNEKKDKLAMTGAVIVAIFIALGLFVILPYGLSLLFGKFVHSLTLLSFIEGGFRLIIFFIYVYSISKLEEIKRVFMYHGAEHKCINCIENGMPLDLEHVGGSSRLHKRCGTSFLLIVMLISIIFFAFIRVPSPILRLVIRLALIPLIAGIAYEFIKLAGRTDNKVVSFLSKPGLFLQKLTTSEPDDTMIEVGIKAVEAVFDWRTFIDEDKHESML